MVEGIHYTTTPHGGSVGESHADLLHGGNMEWLKIKEVE